MIAKKVSWFGACVAAGAAMVSSALAETYEITVKNLTYAQIFSPPLAAAHNRRLKIFEAGEEAGLGLEILAEDGSPATLANELVLAGADVAVNGGGTPAPVLPGESATFYLDAGGRNNRISVVGMLITTNDAFFGLNSTRVRGARKTVRVVAYDSGTEANTEDCAHIPGPPCGNGGNGDNGPEGEGFIHIHRGIHGDEEDGVNAASHDWRNPVAEITIKRVPRKRYDYEDESEEGDEE